MIKITTGNHYLAYVLSDECKKWCLDNFPKRHEITVCHHVTIAYDFSDDDVEKLQTFIDSNPVFHISKFITSDCIDFLEVHVNGELMETSSSTTHLTFSRKLDSRNSDSNLVNKGFIQKTGEWKASGLLFGEFQLINKI